MGHSIIADALYFDPSKPNPPTRHEFRHDESLPKNTT